ncbi:type II secretion system F family protein, partial [Patescibacteria group bacterium]
YSAIVKSGEMSGKLHESLGLVADQMERDFRLKRKVRGAMTYPVIVVLAMIIIGILMLIYVVPTLVSTFEGMGVELPASTRLVIWFSNSLIANSIFFIVGLATLIIGFYFFSKTEISRRIMGTVFIKTPIISSLVRKINAARTARTLSALLGSGVDIIESIDVTIEVVQNYHYKKVLRNAKAEIKKGLMISKSFKKAEDIYPPLVGEMIAVGEETGKLSEMLDKLAGFYESEVNETTKDMATIVEPVLMLFIGAVVGFFAISMMKPMYSMMGGI